MVCLIYAHFGEPRKSNFFPVAIKYTTHYLKGIIIPYMLSSIYIFKATGSCLPTGDISSASRYIARQASSTHSRIPSRMEPPRRSWQLCHLVLTIMKDYTLVSVLLLFSNVLAVSQSEVKVWRLILTAHFTFCMTMTLLVFQFSFFWICMTRLNITLR